MALWTDETALATELAGGRGRGRGTGGLDVRPPALVGVAEGRLAGRGRGRPRPLREGHLYIQRSHPLDHARRTAAVSVARSLGGLLGGGDDIDGWCSRAGHQPVLLRLLAGFAVSAGFAVFAGFFVLLLMFENRKKKKKKKDKRKSHPKKLIFTAKRREKEEKRRQKRVKRESKKDKKRPAGRLAQASRGRPGKQSSRASERALAEEEKGASPCVSQIYIKAGEEVNTELRGWSNSDVEDDRKGIDIIKAMLREKI
ncbi:uncharacterized protein ARB_05869 [Trichophyton benhamiae CBS 112371]|uniref:Uncharacterized protein n=1 Tax=Arthroderma benhamiae (strain ATCC MYA-4681 / CBS 112371) TaxID=663331 RepID=D4ANQ2_ARTBC|nr:uncharacterized protein ARB_05869 [Trichophyton benhamiae CBS 112371]EFE34913.1 hypothetical protein ARB_05869 [Trichophyton benhamiae CBS 112371]